MNHLINIRFLEEGTRGGETVRHADSSVHPSFYFGKDELYIPELDDWVQTQHVIEMTLHDKRGLADGCMATRLQASHHVPMHLLPWWVMCINSLVLDCSNSRAVAIELLQSCAKPSIWSFWTHCRWLSLSLFNTCRREYKAFAPRWHHDNVYPRRSCVRPGISMVTLAVYIACTHTLKRNTHSFSKSDW